MIPSSLFSASEDVSSLPAPPKFICSMDGQTVETSADVWRIRSSADGGKEISINWKLLVDAPQAIFSPRAIILIKLHLADKIARNKAWTVSNAYQMFNRRSVIRTTLHQPGRGPRALSTGPNLLKPWPEPS
jgi:hypothetical protein